MKLDAQEIDDAIQVIARARADGRPIVPLVGGGLSAESGIPTIYSLIHYFALLQAYVANKAYLPARLRETGEHPLKERMEKYGEKLRSFIDDFGWPGLNELIDGLWRWAGQGKKKEWDLDREAVEQLDRLAKKIHPGRFQALPEEGPVIPGRSWRWDAIAEWTDLVRHVTTFDDDLASRLFSRLQRGRQPSLGHRCLAFLARPCHMKLFLSASLDSLLEEALRQEGVPHRDYLLGGRSLPDPALVRRTVTVLKLFGDAAQPALGDQYEKPVDRRTLERLTQMLPKPTPLLLVVGCSGRGRYLIDLVEHAFVRSDPEENNLRVLWLHHEKDPPPSVLALRDRSRERSGDARVEMACVNNAGLFLRHLYASLTSRHHAVSEPYEALERRPTPLLLDPPLVEVLGSANGQGSGIKEYGNNPPSPKDPPTLLVLDNLRGLSYGEPKADEAAATAPTASERLAEWMNEQEGFTPIWVDLEGQYTLPGVVGAIIDQCRRHDADISPAVLPLDEKEEASEETIHAQIEKAARRLGEALQRGRYAVALDGLEMLPWPHTSHHGITRGEREVPRSRRLLQGFVRLLTELNKAHPMALRSSRIAVSVNGTSGRHAPDPDNAVSELLEKSLRGDLAPGQGLLQACGLFHRRTFLDPRPARTDIPLHRQEGAIWVPAGHTIRQKMAATGPAANRADLVLFVASCFRRTRSLVAMRAILGPLALEGEPRDDLGPYAEVDEVLKDFVDAGYFIPLEGGLYWMKRPVRDRVYSENSYFTTTDYVLKVFQGPQAIEPTELALMLQQLVVLALHHDRIARHYYAETFAQSKDALAFFEYVYHRVSSIRYLTKLDLVLEAAWRGLNPAKEAKTPPELVTRVCHTLAALLPIDRDYLQCGRKSYDWLADGAELRSQVRSRRVQQLKSLRIAWEAAADILQTRASAEHIISWCHWLLEDDLPRFFTAYYARRARETKGEARKEALGHQSDQWAAICNTLDTSELRASWWDLRDALYDLWARCCHERGDTDSLRRLCAEYYGSLNDNLNPQALGALPSSLARCVEILTAGNEDGAAKDPEVYLQAIKWKELLKVVFPAPQHRQSPVERYAAALGPLFQAVSRGLRTRFPDLANGLRPKDNGDLLNALKKDAPPGSSESLRCVELWAEEAARTSDWEGLEKVAEEGLSQTRQIDFTERHAADRFPYFRYWSSFLRHRARARWSQARKIDKLAERNKQFRLAYRDLEMARGRSEMNPSRTSQAELDLAAAECALDHAQTFLDGKEDKDADRAAAKLDMADSYRERALDHLKHGRRNVVWWRDYFRLLAVHKARRNACRLKQLGAPKELWRPYLKSDREKNGKPARWDEVKGAVIAEVQSWAVNKGPWEEVRRRLPSFVSTLRQGLFAVGLVLDLKLDFDDDPILNVRNELVEDALTMGAIALAHPASPFLEPLQDGEWEDQISRGLAAVNEYVQDLAKRSDALDLTKKDKWPAFPFLFDADGLADPSKVVTSSRP